VSDSKSKTRTVADLRREADELKDCLYRTPTARCRKHTPPATVSAATVLEIFSLELEKELATIPGDDEKQSVV
jgi:hypothetical protein